MGDTTWIGADPGGAGSFGLAELLSDGTVDTHCADCAKDAVMWLVRARVEHIGGVGVDAPLWWSAGKSGDRMADQWIRRTYRIAAGTVQATNSLRGAALVQGALFVERLRAEFGPIPVTEAHPKAMRKALGLKGRWKAVGAKFGIVGQPGSEHEEDAIVAAVAAREGFSGRWTHDLSEDRLAAEQDPKAHWLAPVHYFWPE